MWLREDRTEYCKIVRADKNIVSSRKKVYYGFPIKEVEGFHL